MNLKISELDFEKGNGLIPSIIQDNRSNEVLMLGYMNQDALKTTIESEKVTFFSRSKNRLWTKGETSANFLNVISISFDCDKDALLIKVIPEGPTCHKGTSSCFGEADSKGFLYKLEDIIEQKIESNDEQSYTNELFRRGINKVAQKVGEEAVEVVIEAKDDNDDLFLNESADLLYHFLILLKAKGKKLKDVEEVLQKRNE
ncbi:bifunctional phosphoribosyl-AMP cyclohydrolase/phosphoribosyl-ATP diphosphatase HisIE [Parvicella tangerina]|uniref:Histidine biosynthesis bifunctional protein HisIE n=1 Tax=Parvicella tangerina TaxID=2829795 RepID=A0A916NHC4_9FLAO|nr:bifunctional phosphoribosyl-AMP cyclohydrolase/phosphoribosyl-ATP diphosphatase HisIE [Parvicella tangerina]CAG5081325.1 Histidine biosynthesis bifunctional protein HisIE [Parvicella tangerina]